VAVAHRVYAEALLQASKENDVLAPVREEFDAFAAALAGSDALRGFLRNPQVETETKLAALDDLPEPDYDTGRRDGTGSAGLWRAIGSL